MARAVSSQQHGVKRRADESFENEQRLAKRFNLLNLEQNPQIWNPTTAAHESVAGITIPNRVLPVSLESSSYFPTVSSVSSCNTTKPTTEYMQVEDTPYKIYIHDLDEELAEISTVSGEEKVVFLPEIEKHLDKLTKHVISAGDTRVTGNELILYSEPTSLSVPMERDSVRKAVLESRARARALALGVGANVSDGTNANFMAGAESHGAHAVSVIHGNGKEDGSMEDDEDPEAMDLG